MTASKLLADYIVGLQHIGHVVTDIEAAIDRFVRVYGVDRRTVRRLPDDPEGADTLFAFLTIAGTEFELIQPVSERFRDILLATASGGAGINHVGWRERNIDAYMRLLVDTGIGSGHVTRDGIVTFKHLRLIYLDAVATDGMLVELIEFVQG